jgi:uncharacterized repeat protein (TIGR02543 family)
MSNNLGILIYPSSIEQLGEAVFVHRTLEWYNTLEIISDLIQEPQDFNDKYQGWTYTSRYTFSTGNDLSLFDQIYSIQFETNSDISIEPINQYFKTSLELPYPELQGYTFEGWYRDPDFINLFTENKMPAENIVLYGLWSFSPEG